MNENASGYLLETREIVKRFGGLTAVDRVSVGVRPGEVLALVGDNGAGKSTLIKLISGVYKPDEGSLLVQGSDAHIESPRDALEAGIETIYQDLALAENLDVGANIFLGRERIKRRLGLFRVLDDAAMAEEAKSVLDRLDIRIPSLRSVIRTLSGGQRQAVAISRSIYWKAKVLVMDEPTAALGIAEQRKVLDLVRTLRDQGIGVIVISHQMYDVFEVADRIAVMRRGQLVGERLVRATDPDEIVGLIVGSETVTKR